METIIKSEKKQVKISYEKPFVIIGEKINPTGRKKLAAAISNKDFDYIRALAVSQVEAGADILDVNVGVPGLNEVAMLPEVVKVVSEVVDVPICLDSPNWRALEAALKVLPGKPLVNSVNGETESLKNILPLIKDSGAAVIGLTIHDEGIPKEASIRVQIAETILNRAATLGIPENDVIIDPLVMTVGADSNAAAVTLETIRRLREKFQVNINLGASNVSFGLPDRHTVNEAFLALAMGAGATCAITDPEKLTGIIRAADLLIGRDDYGGRYIRYWRSQQPKE